VRREDLKKCLVVNRDLKTTLRGKGCEIIFLSIWDLMTEEII